jgi:hypothetical protein
MPYGIAKELGGDTASNDAKLEACIAKVMAKGASKISAIKICKASMRGKSR